jgi:hypothetical protein
MATSGDMVKAVAQLFDLPESKVETFDRRLSEHGLRSKAGRGRGAAQMVGLDVVNLTFAVLSGVGMMDVPAATAAITNLKRGPVSVRSEPMSDEPFAKLAEGTDWHFPDPDELKVFPLSAELVRANTFGEAVALYVDAMATDRFKLSEDVALTMTVTNDGPSAALTCRVGRMVLKAMFGSVSAADRKPEIEERRTLQGTTLEKLAAIIRPA